MAGSVKQRRGRSASGKPAALSLSGRSGRVWGCLLASMTVVGGVLWTLQSPGSASAAGWSVPALASVSGATSIEAVFSTRAPLQGSRWKAIVIHHSGAAYGTPATRSGSRGDARPFHFVIGNGQGMDDGELHVSSGWLDQLGTAHAQGAREDFLAEHAIGICLVGDGERTAFSELQMRRLVQLVTALRQRLDIPADQIHLHRDVAPVPDPGRFFSEAAFREQLSWIR